jgi:hypothetical protein
MINKTPMGTESHLSPKKKLSCPGKIHAGPGNFHVLFFLDFHLPLEAIYIVRPRLRGAVEQPVLARFAQYRCPKKLSFQYHTSGIMHDF